MIAVCLIAILATAGLTAVHPIGTAVMAQGQSVPAPPPKGFKAFTDPTQRFSLVYPDKWKPVAGARDLLLTLASSDLKTLVVVERQQIPGAISEITERFRGLEVESLKNRQPDASDVTSSVAKDRPRTMVIEYSRPGINGPERLRQVSIYEGMVVLRVTCIAPAKDFAKTAAQFDVILSSVKVLG